MMHHDHSHHEATEMERDTFPVETATLADTVSVASVGIGDGDSLDLTAIPVRKCLGNAVVRMLASNGPIPGPSITGPQDAHVTVHFTNQTDLDTSVGWHGVRVDNRYDGAPHRHHQGMQPPIPSGESVTYELSFPDPRVLWYHAHL